MIFLLATAIVVILPLKATGYDPCANPDPTFLKGKFPPGFMWSSATAAYQIEGAWNVNGKGESIWDRFVHQKPSPIVDNTTGDVACDSYHRWMQDIDNMKAVGLKYYRFSISWPRLVPTGIVAEGINPDGYRYYRTLITNLIANGITPMVTIYHWDLPQALQDKGGWLNSTSISWYLNYAQLCFTLFGDEVKYWITFNEPWVATVNGYAQGNFAPGIKNCPGTCPYIVAHNIIRAHAQAWRLYDTKFRTKQNGKVGITFNALHKVPNTTNPADVAATERAMQFKMGWFANPIFNNGDYPQVMKDFIGRKSKAEGLKTSRLPSFTAAEKAYIKGSFDFYGINIYTTIVISYLPYPSSLPPNYFTDADTTYYQCPQWGGSGSSWLKFTPWAMRGLLNWVKIRLLATIGSGFQKTYNNPPTIITENGWSDNTGTTTDPLRVKFYKYYLNSAMKAINLDGCNVKGYTTWSIMDNFEWASGLTEKFGIYSVNFSDPNRKRVAKDSAFYLASVINHNGFPYGEDEN